MKRPSNQIKDMLAKAYEQGKYGTLYGCQVTEYSKEELIGALEILGNQISRSVLAPLGFRRWTEHGLERGRFEATPKSREHSQKI